MSPKTKIVLAGLGLIGLNVFVFAMLAFWPTGVPSEGEVSATTSAEVASEVYPVEIQQKATSAVPVADLPAERTEEPIQKPTENAATEVDNVPVPVYTKGTVLEAMEAYRDVSGTFTFSGTQYPGIGMFIDKVQGRSAENGYYWILYINGDTADFGVSRAEVSPGDIVEWHYEPNIY